ncbi:MAG: TRAP transporter large permease [Agathobaculum sp.]|jgi:tripartite ATP-independent transporter DctM subunit|uniref:TRAP transporter large permease n=1 Tax=Agathobaculum sp. TaxID=2048138 RepID=UPI003D8DEC5E
MVVFPLILLFVMFIFNIPVAFCLMMAALSYFVLCPTGLEAFMVVQRMVASSESFPMLAIPFFILAGTIMTYSGISSRLMSFAECLTGHMNGGLGQVNVLLSALMGGVSGSSNADAAMQSKMLVPEMVKRGYSKAFSAAVTAASACITPIIPPGITLILFAFMAEQSVSKMFIAGIVPGILITVALMIVVTIISRRKGYKPVREKRATGREIWHEFVQAIWALFMPFGLIMGLRFGVFTASEAGAVSVVYTLIVGFFIYKELKPNMIGRILKESIQSTCSVMLIIVSAAAFSYYMSWERIPQMVTNALVGLTSSPWVLLLIINIFLLILGMFLEGTASLIILTPLLLPVTTALGIDPIHLGILMVVNITLGGMTPPFGTLIFVVCSTLKLEITEFIKESIPFIIAMLIVLGIITYLPGVVMFLPNLIG